MNRQILLWAIVVALAAASAPGSKVRSASAPLYTSAYYEQQVNTSTYYSQGCALGTQARNYQIAQNVLSALDLGRPIVQNGQYGTSHFVVNAFASTSTIQNAVVEFAHGFWVCTGSDITAHLRIAVGTNNYLMDGWTNTQMSAHGQA